MKDTEYALKTYLQTYDNTVSQYVPLQLFPDQVSLLKDYEDYEENIALKYRQAGVSTVTAAWVSKRLVFAKKNKPEKILIIANKLDTSQEMANKIRAFIDQWPNWVGAGFAPEKNSQRHYKLNNGSEVKAVATSKDGSSNHSINSFSMQPTIWKKKDFINLYLNCNSDKFGENYNYTFTLNRLNMNGCYYYNEEPARGGHHDSSIFPYIATAIVKGKWNYSEYPSELDLLFKEYNIDKHLRGCR